jgi:hypothetical protein
VIILFISISVVGINLIFSILLFLHLSNTLTASFLSRVFVINFSAVVMKCSLKAFTTSLELVIFWSSICIYKILSTL